MDTSTPLFPEGVSGIESLWSVLISFRLYPRPYPQLGRGHLSLHPRHTVHPTLFDLATPLPSADDCKHSPAGMLHPNHSVAQLLLQCAVTYGPENFSLPWGSGPHQTYGSLNQQESPQTESRSILPFLHSSYGCYQHTDRHSDNYRYANFKTCVGMCRVHVLLLLQAMWPRDDLQGGLMILTAWGLHGAFSGTEGEVSYRRFPCLDMSL